MSIEDLHLSWCPLTMLIKENVVTIRLKFQVNEFHKILV